MSKAFWILLFTAWVCSVDGQISAVPSKASVPPEFAKSIQPFFAQHCYSCHNDKMQSGGLNLQKIGASATVDDGAELEKILRRLQAGEMPPK